MNIQGALSRLSLITNEIKASSVPPRIPGDGNYGNSGTVGDIESLPFWKPYAR